ncbi:RNA polymerase sigma factor [Streptomyces mangrovisoli]|uniref:RNA polymerase sigma factor 70 region 4 type 2 domain-containing protein n=1 Tax=Streptomyces mangrovisoli TaxID=1428628 RepID=A0A1J4NQ58_9ACTN|nr:sigma-70 family RNA polymerase sigma factor [Streptomyces mangrovisoli]OIJ64569.1 hypothetical protein WN71_028190 [Streptomyces mangrovisoli]
MSAAADDPAPDPGGAEDACEREIEVLYAAFQPVVQRKATLAAAGHTQDAWDATQHAFIKAWEHLRRPDAPHVANWQGWLVKTAVRHVLFARRHDSSTVPLEDTDRPGDQVLLEDHVVLKETYQSTLDAIADLTERQRQALVLVHIAGCSTTEAARDMGVTNSTVRNLIHQARSRLTAATGEASDV